MKNEKIGMRFGRLTVISQEETTGKKKKYRCACDCGSECVVRGDSLTNGHTQSCGCLMRERQSEANRKEIKPGTKYGRLTVIERAGEKAKNGAFYYKCLCDCGTEKTVDGTNLRNGKTLSCGCLRKERQKEATKTHGGYKSRLYQIWDAMVQRCTNPNHQSFCYYGGRGISVCAEWRASFSVFREWAIANGYDETAPKWECTLDRGDTNGDYTPENCRWVTQKEQMNNTRRCHIVTVDGITMNLAQWAQRLGVKRGRLYKASWSGKDMAAYIKKIIRERGEENES